MSQLSSRQQLYLAPKGTPSKLFASHFAAAEPRIGSAGLLKEVSFHLDPGCFERVRLSRTVSFRPWISAGADHVVIGSGITKNPTSAARLKRALSNL